MPAGTIEIFTGINGDGRFRVKSRNGKIVGGGEGYYDERNAERGAKSLVRIIKAGVKIKHVKD
jgi:uncharacterized protein YegP (UPF0339 family)